MSSYALPFPDRSLADQELTYDPCYSRIPEADRDRIVDAAWNKGCAAARAVYEQSGGSADFVAICKDSGLTLIERDIDYVSGNQRYFSDYVSGKNCITLYLRSIDLWAEQNHMTRLEAENLILSHEYYHYLEWNRLGLTSRDYQVPMISIGPIRLGKTGIRALSEIGAHGFAHTYHHLLEAQNGDNQLSEQTDPSTGAL